MINTCEQSVDDLAIGLGMLMGAEGNPPERKEAYECFVESVLVLAKNAGVDRDRALRPFDMHRESALTSWDRI